MGGSHRTVLAHDLARFTGEELAPRGAQIHTTGGLLSSRFVLGFLLSASKQQTKSKALVLLKGWVGADPALWGTLASVHSYFDFGKWLPGEEMFTPTSTSENGCLGRKFVTCETGGPQVAYRIFYYSQRISAYSKVSDIVSELYRN